MRQRYDIFCRVIDNFGDIGICFRLAAQLVEEYQMDVRLYVDDLSALCRIRPDATYDAKQKIAGINIVHWNDALTLDSVGDVVIEAFGCELPPVTVALMQAKHTPPIWLNLEYLSAEQWVEDCHLLNSTHPQSGLKKTFFFPGFSSKTGGIICEKWAFKQPFDQHSREAQSFLANLGILPSHPDTLNISLFSYENAALKSLIKSWQDSPRPVRCLIPEGKTLISLRSALNGKLPSLKPVTVGSLTLQVIPFMAQPDYDQLLNYCDINFVRGEDSLVRGLLAAKPLIWHIYPQEEEAHLIKLKAFLQQYLEDADEPLKALIGKLFYDWNLQSPCSTSWSNILTFLDNWRQYSTFYQEKLNSLPDLAANMVQFCKKTL